jgi:cytochrome c
MSGLEMNKIAAGVLIAGLTALAIGKVSGLLYHPEMEPKTRGFSVAVAEETASPEGGSAAAAEPDIATLLAKADAVAGATVSKKCTSCHDMSKGGANKVGPGLWGVVGAAKGHHAGFAYSDALKAKGGNWDDDALNQFIKKPKDFVPGTKMAFAGIAKPEDRANLIAYLHSLSDSPIPLPAAPAVAPATAKP